MNKRAILLLACLWSGVCMTVLQAQSRYHVQGNDVRHYLVLSLGGGEANTTFTSVERISTANPYLRLHTGFDEVKNSAGADALGELSYEIRKNNFFFGFVGDAHYTYTGQTLEGFRDEYTCLDVNGDEMEYRYDFRNYEEIQHTLWVGGGIRLGYYFTEHFYGAVGAKVDYPLLHTYQASTNIATNSAWHFAVDNVESAPGENSFDYGLFSERPFSYGGDYMAKKEHLTVSPCLELGAHFQLANRFILRVAAYAEYALPVQLANEYPLVDYSNVVLTPLPADYVRPEHPCIGADHPILPPAYCQEFEQLENSLRLWSFLDFAGQQRDYGRLSVGLKLAFVLDVTVHVPHCTTCTDDGGFRYVQPRKQRRKQVIRYNGYGNWF